MLIGSYRSFPCVAPTKLCGIRQKPEILHSDFGSELSGEGLIRSPVWMNFLLGSAVSKYLGYFPDGLVEFHVFIDTLYCPALGLPVTCRPTTGLVRLIFVFILFGAIPQSFCGLNIFRSF